LIQKGLLQNDYEHGSLKLTPKAWHILKGKEIFFGKLEEPEKERSTVQQQQDGGTETFDFDAELFEILRAKRKEIADQANVPPYVIFHDRTLREMAFYYPKSKETLAIIYGIGRGKLEKYADVFLDIIRAYCQARQCPEKQKPLMDAPAAPREHGGSLRHMVIGERFNEGRTIEQLAADFGIRPNTVIDHLCRHQQNQYALNRKHLLACSGLTDDQRNGALSSFGRLGTERLRPVYEDLQEKISYDELKLLRLFLLCGALSCAEDRKTFVVLAASRKYGGFCIAGREWTEEKIGPWIRPVSQQENGELAAETIRLHHGRIPQYLDVITIETQGSDDHPYPKENVLIAEQHPWSWQCKLPPDDLPRLADDVDELWPSGFHSANGINDRMPEELLREANWPSLYLIRPDDVSLLISDDLDGRKKVRARFSYRDMPYLLSATDPGIERTYLMKAQGEYPLNAGNLYLTVSLGEPFNGFCYKLVAAVIFQDQV